MLYSKYFVDICKTLIHNGCGIITQVALDNTANNDTNSFHNIDLMYATG